MGNNSYLYHHRDLDPGQVQPDGRKLSMRERELIVCERIAERKRAAARPQQMAKITLQDTKEHPDDRERGR